MSVYACAIIALYDIPSAVTKELSVSKRVDWLQGVNLEPINVDAPFAF